MLRTLAVLLLSAGVVQAQVTTRPPGASGAPAFTGGTITTPILGPSGCTAPPISFSSDGNAGLCLAATNDVKLQSSATGDRASLELAENTGNIELRQYGTSGTVFSGLAITATQLAVVASNVSRFNVTSTAATSTVPFIAANGTAAAPSFTFSGGTNVGLYFNGLGQTGVASSGVPVMSLGVAMKVRSDATFNWISTTGDVAAAAADTGLARVSANRITATNGATAFGGSICSYYSAGINLCLDSTNSNPRLISSGSHWFVTGGSAQDAFLSSSTHNLSITAAGQFAFSSGTNAETAPDTGLARSAAAVTRATDGSAGLGYSIFGQAVEANAATKAPTIVESGELYTNTGDADGSIINLPDDPTIGTQFRVALTVAQTVTINAATGESIQDAGTNAASRAASAIGDTIHLIAVTGGSGAVWMVVSKTGTWT
jgi:hypothetical protein